MSSASPILVLAGVAGTQGYIFASNRLKENVGASYLVAERLRALAHEPGRACIMEGGGNAAILFDNDAEARDAVQTWSAENLRVAPGARFVAVRQAVEGGNLKDAYDKASAEWARQSEAGVGLAQELPAPAIVRACPWTGQAAAEALQERKDVVLVAPSVLARHEAFEQADKKLKNFLTAGLPETATSVIEDAAGRLEAAPSGRNLADYAFPAQFEHLGGGEGYSRIAVVHIDGDGLGQQLTNIRNAQVNDEELRQGLQRFAASVDGAGRISLVSMLSRLAGLDADGTLAELGIRTAKPGMLPVRPLVYGGDDVTFVCDARIALPLVVWFQRAFAQQPILGLESAVEFRPGQRDEIREAMPILGLESAVEFRATACAGVAVVHASYPFARAYHLAEELCSNAKKARRDQGGQGSWLDFEVVMGSLTGDLETLRETRKAPQTVSKPDPWRLGTGRSVEQLEADAETFGKWPRGKRKELELALDRGAANVTALLTHLTHRGHKAPASDQSGWADALAAIDLGLGRGLLDAAPSPGAAGGTGEEP